MTSPSEDVLMKRMSDMRRVMWCGRRPRFRARSCETSSEARRGGMELTHRQHGQYTENDQRDALRDPERRLRQRGLHRMQRRYLLERLRNRHEDKEIRSDARGHSIDPAPGTAETESVERKDRDRERDERDDADPMRRLELFKRK